MLVGLAEARRRRNLYFLLSVPLLLITLVEIGVSLILLIRRESERLPVVYTSALSALTWIDTWHVRGWQFGPALVRIAPIPDFSHRLNVSNLWFLFWWIVFAVSYWLFRSARRLSEDVASARTFARAHTWRHQKPGHRPAAAPAVGRLEKETDDSLLLAVFPRELKWSEQPVGIITLSLLSVTAGVLVVLLGQYIMLKLGWITQ